MVTVEWSLSKCQVLRPFIELPVSEYFPWLVNNIFCPSRITLSCEHQAQWTMGVTHHKAWTIGWNGTVCMTQYTINCKPQMTRLKPIRNNGYTSRYIGFLVPPEGYSWPLLNYLYLGLFFAHCHTHFTEVIALNRTPEFSWAYIKLELWNLGTWPLPMLSSCESWFGWHLKICQSSSTFSLVLWVQRVLERVECVINTFMS